MHLGQGLIHTWTRMLAVQVQGMTSSKVGIHSTFRINLPNTLKLAETEKFQERVYKKVYSVENRLDTNL